MGKTAYKFPRMAPVERLERRLLLSSQPYTWQNAAIGGGGFVDGVFFSPTQKNVIYVRTDIGGLYKTTNGGTSWNQLLDFVGPAPSPFGFNTNNQDIGVLSFAIDPENPNNLYADVGEYSGTNGAVLYSTDGGSSWGETNLTFYVGGNSNGRGEGERIAVDPYDSSIILLGSNANGLWESTNSAHTFAQVSGISTTASINFVYFNPYIGTSGNPTQNIYVGLDSIAGLSPQTTAAEPTNLYQTTNGGSTWTQVAGSASSPGKNIASTAVSTLSRSGTTATAKTSVATSIQPGDLVTVAGASPAAFNGTFTVASVTNSTTFSYTIASGTGTATGTITAKVNYSEMPNHMALASDGNLYLTYSDAQAPNGTQTTGGVYRYNTSSGIWTVISPQVPGAGSNPQFGYIGLALDPQNPSTLVVTTINDYSGPDALWRTTDANSANVAWVALYNTSSAQNYGYGGYDTTRNTSTAPWIAPFGDGIGNWPCSVAIDPFSSGHILYGDGQGLWATDIGNSNTPLSGANSWYFPDTGIEFTAVGRVAAAPSGVPLFSAMGDIDGFAHTTLTTSPSQGAIAGGSGNSIDFAGTNPNDVAIVGSMGNTNGAYSTNDGLSFTAFASAPSGASNGSVAVTYGGSTFNIVWAPSGQAAYYSTNDGTTWTASAGGLPTGGTIIADRVNPNDFYYYSENTSDNQLSVYISTNGGASFVLASTTATGNCSLTASPYTAGDLWLTSYSGLWHSTNFGSSFNYGAGIGVQNASILALGKNAPGQSYPAIYIWGELNNVTGVYRSDDQGATWIQVNDAAHQWGGLVQTIAADPNVFGRVYLGINGRGVIVGNPVTSVPSGWSDSDVNTPGNPGWATSTSSLSNGATVNQWTINGGGAGIAGNSDQFNFASKPETGDASIIAQITSLNNPGTGTPQAGVMIRAGSATATDPFFALVQNTANQLVFEYRTVGGGSMTSTTLTGVAFGNEYVNLVRSGNIYSAYYGTDGVHWTQLGGGVTISAIPATASAGLAVTSNYNPQLASASFNNVQLVSTFTDLAGNHNDVIELSPLVPGQLQIFIDVPETSTPSYIIMLSQMPSLTFNFGSGTESLTIDYTNGNPVPPGGLNVNSGSGNAFLTAIGATPLTTANVVINDNAFVAFNAGTAAALNYIPISMLNLAPSATAVVSRSTTPANRSVLITNAVTFNGQGKLDLTNSDMIVHGGNFTSLVQQVNPLGSFGIVSSTAAVDPTHLTTLGIIQNSTDGTPTGPAIYTTAAGGMGLFDGLNLADTDVLFKYTYFGDADLNGIVDGSDYSRIDSGYLAHATGWFNGDFNYDQVIDGSDYTLIDNAFNSQGTSMAAVPANQLATVTVESVPSTLNATTTAERRQIHGTTAPAVIGQTIAAPSAPTPSRLQQSQMGWKFIPLLRLRHRRAKGTAPEARLP